MTEKRFTLHHDVDGIDYIQDETNGFCFICDKLLCSLLNELNDENEQLKKEYLKLKHRHSLLHDVCLDAECERDGYHKDVLSLEKENEQLKKKLKKYTDAFDYSQCRFQNYDWFDDGDEFEVCEKGNNEAQMKNHSCKNYGLNCLKCPYWNKWSRYCTKWKIWSETH